MIELPEIRIEVERSRRETVEVAFEVEPKALELEDDPEYRFVAKVRGHLRARMIGGETIHVRGEATTEARAACVRCLEELPIPVRAPIDLMFLPEPSAADKHRFAQLEEDEKLYYSGDFLHPAEQLREELMVNLPYLPSCELGPGDVCPLQGKRIEYPIVGGDAEAESPKAPEKVKETGNTLAAQLARVRKQMGKG
jgi:uncharacterized metal-binding protein YceD (DUF177 family)